MHRRRSLSPSRTPSRGHQDLPFQSGWVFQLRVSQVLESGGQGGGREACSCSTAERRALTATAKPASHPGKTLVFSSPDTLSGLCLISVCSPWSAPAHLPYSTSFSQALSSFQEGKRLVSWGAKYVVHKCSQALRARVGLSWAGWGEDSRSRRWRAIEPARLESETRGL